MCKVLKLPRSSFYYEEKPIKTEFVFDCEYADLAEFKLLWFDYVNWYNHVRIHGSLGYVTPDEWHRF